MGKRRYREANKEMEYPDAPSGYVRLYNYKEPFMRFNEGFGYQGVLLMDGSGETVQCHFCGEWMPYIGHWHLKKHGMTAMQYKEAVGLDLTSALVSEKQREKLINHTPPKRKDWSEFTKEEQEAISAKYRATMAKRTREKENQRGTCPEQLIDWLRKKSEELGREPTSWEIRTRRDTLKCVFGSVQNAYKAARLKPRTINSSRNFGQNPTKEEWLKRGTEFYQIHGRVPTLSDHRRGLIAPDYQRAAYRFTTHKKFRDAILKCISHH